MAKLLKLLQIKIPQKYGDIFFKSKGCCKTIEAMPIWSKFWSSRLNNGDAIEIVANKKSFTIRVDIFFQSKGCSKTI